MSALSTMRVATKEHCSIATSNTTYDDFILRQLNAGQQDFATESNWKYLEKRGSMTSSTFRFKYTLASDTDVISTVLWEHDHYLTPINHDRWMRLNLSDSTGNPRYYIVQEGSLCLYPKPDNAGAINSLFSGMSATGNDSLHLIRTNNFEEKGRILVDSEVMEYAHAVGATLKILTRGLEGTTKAAHAAGADVYYRNIEYDYYKVLSDMSNDADVSAIPVRYHRAMPLFAAAKFFYKTEDKKQGDSFMADYLRVREQAKRDLGIKQDNRFSTVLEDTPERYRFEDNTIPDDGSLS